jgi:hypothetical protein
MEAELWSGSGPRRIARSRALIDGLSREIDRWLAARRDDPQFARFANHFGVLEVVLGRMLEKLAAVLPSADSIRATSGEVYERCRAVDESLLTVRRTYEWYATKYDQRLDEDDRPALLAADEIVRSCWRGPFEVLRRDPPTGPLAFLDTRFDACATSRNAVPTDLRAPADSPVVDLVNDLPVPTIALPAWATSEAWWLALAAHETGHHIQKDLVPGLEATTRRALMGAVGDELAGDWSHWGQETFADAYSVLMIGRAATWPVADLQHASARQLTKTPEDGDRYPPAAVRLALLGECVAYAGAGAGEPSAQDVRDWLAGLAPEMLRPGPRAVLDAHLAVVPKVAQALIDLPIDANRTLRAVSEFQPEWFSAGGRVWSWSLGVRQPNGRISPINVRPAARLAVAAGVSAWLVATAEESGGSSAPETIHANLLRLLPACGVPGTLAAPPKAIDIEALADELADRIMPVFAP